MARKSGPTYRLPPRAYLDPAWLDLEHQALFDRTWALVASSSEVSRPGETIAVVAGASPVFVTRRDDGALAAFHNLCRHRGMAVVDGGASRRPASVGEWEGMVFVNPDPAALPLAEFLSEVVPKIGSFRPGLLREVARVDLVGAFNWKLFVENHIDVLHLWYLHHETLADFDHSRFAHEAVGRHWVSYEPLRQGAGSEQRLAQGTTAIGHLSERDRLGIGAHLIFPNILMASAAEFFLTYAVVPISPDCSRVELRARAEPGADPDALVTAARSFIDEDIAACEAIQAVMRSPRFQVGPLAATHEAPIAAFHDHLLAALGGLP